MADTDDENDHTRDGDGLGRQESPLGQLLAKPGRPHKPTGLTPLKRKKRAPKPSS